MMFGRPAAAIQGEKPHCPQCDGVELRRHGRIGLWQRVVMPRFGLFPWECGLCRKIFFLSQRSTDYRHHSTEYRQHAAEESLVPLKLELVRAPGSASVTPAAPKAVPVRDPARNKQHKHAL